MRNRLRISRLKPNSQDGFTLVELLIGMGLALLVAAATFGFYFKQHGQLLAQAEISNSQQSVRACLDEIVTSIRLAGAGMPAGMAPVVGRNTDPDTIYIRYNETGCIAEVGQNTAPSSPIQIPKGWDISCFSTGERVYHYRRATGLGEWFNVTGIDSSDVTWNEVEHSGQTLGMGPQIGDSVFSCREVKFWIDRSDPQHPKLMRKVGNGPDELFAEEIEDFQCIYVLSTGASTSAPAPGDLVKSVVVTVQAKTEKKDVDFKENSGYRKRSLSTVAHLRNTY